MADPDVCLQQLQTAKKEIANTEAANKSIDADKESTKAEYDAAAANYEAKKVAQTKAKKDLEDYKSNRTAFEREKGGWGGSECQDTCQANAQGGTANTTNYPEGAIYDHENRCESRGAYGECFAGQWRCICYSPDVNEYKKRHNAWKNATAATATAKADMESKKTIYEAALSKPYKSPQINIACCQNSMTCATGADCAKITQNCEAKITSLKEEKTAKAEADAIAAAKAAGADAAAAAAAGSAARSSAAAPQNNNPSSVGQQSSNNSGSNANNSASKDSSSNTALIGGGVGLFSCCSSIVLVIIIIMMMKK
jgi:hypothetical protein